MKILVSNYAMNDDDPIFAHQIEAVRALALKFEKVQVITHNVNQMSISNLNSNVHVANSVWKSGKNLSNSFRFLQKLINVLREDSFSCAFFHMTEVSACLALPILKFKKIPCILWYAHKSNSIYLRVFNIFGSAIVTSTKGSCPIKSEKVHVIGQSINEKLFKYSSVDRQKSKFIFVGRIDSSKKVDEIITALSKFKKKKKNIKLEIYGRIKLDTYGDYVRRMVKNINSSSKKNWIYLHNSIPRVELPKVLLSADCLIHNFDGSLDKVLLEAGSCGLPIVTTNNEFNTEFDLKSGKNLLENLEIFFEMEKSKLQVQSKILRKKILRGHSLDHWVNSITEILNSASKLK